MALSPNLIANGNFDSDSAGNGVVPAGWEAYGDGGTYKGPIAENAVTSPNSFKIGHGSAMDGGIKTKVYVDENQIVSIRVHVKTDANVDNACVVITNDYGGGGGQSIRNVSGNMDAYFTVTPSFPPIDGYYAIFLGLGSFGAQSDGNVWFDDVSFIGQLGLTDKPVDAILSEMAGLSEVQPAQKVIADHLGISPYTSKSIQEMLAGVKGYQPLTARSEQQLWFENVKDELSLSGVYTQYTIQALLAMARNNRLTLAQVLGES